MNNKTIQTVEAKKEAAFEAKVKRVFLGNEDKIIRAGFLGEKHPYIRIKGHIISEYDFEKFEQLKLKVEGLNFQEKNEYEEESIFVSLSK